MRDDAIGPDYPPNRSVAERRIVALASPSRAQMSMTDGGRSLGGYGTATISSYYGGGGGGYVPYNGRAGGFVPYSGDFGGGIGSRPIPRRLPQTPIGGVMMAETPIGGATLSGSMGARGAMGMGADRAAPAPSCRSAMKEGSG